VSRSPARGIDAGPASAHGQEHLTLAVLALILVTFVSTLSSTVVTNALPVILGELNGSSTQYTWVITATLLTSTATTPIWGKLADVTNKKMLLQLSTGIFLGSTVLAGLSQSAGQLIACRALLGVGLGGVQALSMIALAALVPARERGRYGGWFGAAGALAIVGGPLVGGVVVDLLGWRWVFYVVVPFTVLAMVILQRTLRLPQLRRHVRIDYLGSALLVGGVSLLLVWISFAGKSFAWGSPTSVALAVAGVVLLVLALVVEAHAEEPVIPLSLLRMRTPVLSIVGSLGAGMAMFGSAVFFGQYYQVARGYTPTHAGVLTIPMMAGVFVSSVVSGRLVTLTGRLKPYVVAGSVLVVVGFSMLGTARHATPIPFVVLASAVIGIGVGATMQNLLLATQNAVPYDHQGVATSVTTFFRSLGGTVAVAVFGALLATRVQSGITAGLAAAGLPPGGAGSGSSLAIGGLPAQVQTIVRAAFGDALGVVFLCSAGVAVVSLVAVLFIQEVPLRTTLQPEELADPAGLATEPDVAAEPAS
jgi:EmrB/QacA subfamily drug resistance transporter